MDITERLSKLTPEQRKLLDLKLKQQKNGIDLFQIPITVESRNSTGRFPLSFAQERLWFVDQLSHGNPAYNIVRATKLEGDLNKKALEKSIEYILQRHEILRTTFIFEQDKPRQMIHSGMSIPMPVIDLKHLSKEQQEEAVKEIKDRESLFSFDLGKFPLLRTHLLELSPVKFVFLMVIHHIVSDGISAEILLSEFIQSYRFLSMGRAPSLPALPVQYVDYVLWQQRWYGNGSEVAFFRKKQEEYWLNEFSGEIPVLEIPVDYRRPLMQSYEGDIVYFSLSVHRQKALREIASQAMTTLFTVLLALYNIFLSKLSGVEDIVVGTPVSGRRHKSLQRMIGMFVNTLPLRNYPDGCLPFENFLADVKARVLDAFENQEYRYEDIVERAVVTRDTGRNPLFDAAFVLQNQEEAKMDIPGLRISPLPYEPKTSKFDLSFEVIESVDGLRLSFEYCTRLFKKESIRRFTRYFINVVTTVVEDPRIPLSDIEIIDREEKQRILLDFNRTEAPYPGKRTIHSLFEAQAERTPDNIAVHISHKSYLTYSKLNNKSDRLASFLREKGVGTDTAAAVIMERSIDMIVAIFAVLKAGGAYLPVTPDYPKDRIDYILADSRAKVLLTHTPAAPKITSEREIILLDDNDDNSRCFAAPSKPAPVTCSPGSADLAYIIYTSGSTGKPKGVLIEHRSLVNRLNWMQKAYPIGEQDVILQKTTITFDVSVWELFWWSMVGASLCLLEPGGEKNPAVIIETIARGGVTTMHFVPSMLGVFLQYLDVGDTSMLQVLRRVFASGEALMPNHVEQFNRLLNLTYGTELINLYGPTEATIDVSYYNCNNGNGIEQHTTVPIGRPIDNIRLYVLDKWDRLQGIGIAGELCIAGDGLARGYLNRPELTAEKFYRSNRNFEINTTYITYRTGDLARWQSDGNIEFLGRIDHQVKIRGFRIEPGEIENCLLRHEAVKEALILVHEDNKKEKSLCAYFVARSSHTPDRNPFPAARLKEYLAAHLPDYMIPTFFIPLEKFPLTPNGKLDRKALPQPAAASVESQYIAPRSSIEEKLATVWQQVLGVERVGINDNFFQLGGDSIKAIQMAAGLRKYGLDMKIDDLFLHPVIKRLGGRINVIRRVIPQEPVEGEIPLTPIQHWFFNSHPLHRHHFNQALMLYRKTGFDEILLDKVFAAIVEHHDVLRAVVVREGTSAVLRNRGTREKSFELEAIHLEDTFGEELQERIEAGTRKLQESINLETGPFVKLGLFKTSEGDHLLIVIHHLVTDGVSWRILLEDLAAGYEKTQKGEPIIFQAKTDSFQYWSRKLNGYAHGDPGFDNKELYEELNYWKSVEFRSMAPLSCHRKVLANKKENRNNAVYSVQLDREETEKLLRQTNYAYNTEVNDILLTALGLAIKEWDGLEQVLINLEGHGREAILDDVDISRTIGWFTSLYPVLLDMSEVEEISDVIMRVKETLRGVPRRGIGYGILRYLVPLEKRQECPFLLQPEISFNYLGQFGRETLETDTFQFSPLSTGDAVNPAAPALYTFDINGMLIDGQLRISFTFNKLEYERESIEALGRSYHSQLKRIISHCTSAHGRRLGFTPSDFPLAVIDQSRLNQLVERYASNAEIEDIYALSASQQSMIFHHLYSPESSVTVEHEVFGIKSELNIEAFKKVWKTLTERHASLRASFHWQGLDKPLQVIHQNLEVPFNVLDIQTLPATQREEQFNRFLEADRIRGFDLSEPPLMRIFVFKLEKSSFQVVWTYHHLLLDGWCRGILMREIVLLYDVYSRREVTDPEFGMIPPFKNYIRWLKEQDDTKAEEFWREYLKGFTAPILISKNLPYVNDPNETRPFDEIRFEYSEAETQQLMDFGKSMEITLNTFVQGALTLLLCHFSGEEDIVFGATGSGRPTQLDGALMMIGCFMNTVPMRVKVNFSVPVGQWLRDIQLNHSRVRQYEHSSLADIRSFSEVPRASALYDLYETIVVFENYPFDFNREAGMLGTMSSAARLEEQMDYPLTLYIIPGSRLSFKLLFDTRFFNKSTAEQLTAHLVYLLRSFLRSSESLLGEIPIVTGDEASRMTVNWNDTEMEYPAAKTVIHLFEERTVGVPNDIALVFGNIQLTYMELNRQANRLAWGLKANGIRSGRFVALKLDRSVEMVVGILGILKAGAAYLPIPPELPDDRISFILKDSNTDLLLTRDRLNLYCREKEINPVIGVSPHDLAYIIYTSGTTGLPKGVMVEHRNIVNLLIWFGRRYGLEERRHVAQMSDYVFDPSVEQILGTLIFGSVVFLITRDLILDTEGFRSFVESRQIDMVNFVPEALKELLLSKGSVLSGLKTVISGGDRLDESIKDGILRRGYRLYNHYGPTEITVDALTSECSAEKVNLGKPIANTKVYVMDRLSRLVPTGVPGELCIAGDGVTRGYLNAPDLTASKFYMSDKLLVTYRTGDLVRWLPGGNIEFLGRVDQQVKIRGLRVEPGEIESHLLAIDGIKEAVVQLRANERGDKYLCAYFTAERHFNPTEFKEHLISKLPIYMVPSVFFQLEQLPLNPNGKVDFHALPEPSSLPVEEYVAPTNLVEKQLVALWAKVLGLEKGIISVDSNFFDLGGQSLLAMKLVSSIREHFHTKLPLSAFFQVSTIRGIASMIRKDGETGKEEKPPEDHSFASVKFIKKSRIEREV
jgi:amino acid adenylation domain-containing protein/non-ribosomal peptide synthase protein (TIGR01720 family)